MVVFVKSSIVPGVVNVLERMMTDGIIKILEAVDGPLDFHALEIVSSLERGCQFLYSGDQRKLLAAHRRLGIRYTPMPFIPEHIVSFETGIVNSRFDLLPSVITEFNTAKILTRCIRAFFTNANGAPLADALRFWIDVLQASFTFTYTYYKG